MKKRKTSIYTCLLVFLSFCLPLLSGLADYKTGRQPDSPTHVEVWLPVRCAKRRTMKEQSNRPAHSSGLHGDDMDQMKIGLQMLVDHGLSFAAPLSTNPRLSNPFRGVAFWQFGRSR